MTLHIQEDKPNVAYGVHYKVSAQEAVSHFESLGFDAVKNVEIINPSINCGEARKAAVEAAKQNDAKAYYQGAFDVTVGDNCRIYKFEYEDFHGGKNPQGEGNKPYFIGNTDD